MRFIFKTSYDQDIRLLQHGGQRFWYGLLALALLAAPAFVSEYYLSQLTFICIYGIVGVGLMLLTGYTGQVSLGHAFFIGAGAYVAAAVGGDLGLPLVLWLPAAALFGALVGALIGPFALRLRGNYLAIVTLGLVFLGEHLFRNMDGLTGGNSGTSVTAAASIGPIDFNAVTILGDEYIRGQGWFWLVWGLVGLCALLAKNIVRTRPGRAIQAIRDRDVAAEIIGVELGRYKVAAFAVSSGFAALGGALYGAYQQYVSPEEWTLFLSIQYIAIIIVGGVGTVFGAVLGALFLGGLPAVIENYSDSIPGVATTAADDGFISVFSLNQAIFGLLIVLFLMFEPRGLAAMWLRLKAYFKAWPFSY